MALISCKISLNFSYIWDGCVVKKRNRSITGLVNLYYAYFSIKLGNQEKTFIQHKAIRTCIESGLRVK